MPPAPIIPDDIERAYLFTQTEMLFFWPLISMMCVMAVWWGMIAGKDNSGRLAPLAEMAPWQTIAFAIFNYARFIIVPPIAIPTMLYFLYNTISKAIHVITRYSMAEAADRPPLYDLLVYLAGLVAAPYFLFLLGFFALKVFLIDYQKLRIDHGVSPARPWLLALYKRSERWALSLVLLTFPTGGLLIFSTVAS